MKREMGAMWRGVVCGPRLARPLGHLGYGGTVLAADGGTFSIEWGEGEAEREADRDRKGK